MEKVSTTTKLESKGGGDSMSKLKSFEHKGFKFMIQNDEKGCIILNESISGCDKWLDKLIDKINCYSMTKGIDNDKLLEIFIKAYDNNIGLYEKKQPEQNDTENFSIIYHKELDKLKKMISICKPTNTSNEKIASNKSNNMKKIKIFNSVEIINILTTDYMDIFKYLHENKLGTINLLNNSNIYNFCIKLDNFDNELLMKDLKKINSSVEIIMTFHHEYHPNYPPFVTIVGPVFKNSLAIKISNSKYTQLDYWNPERTALNIVKRIINIISKYGQIDVGVTSEKSKIIQIIETNLVYLASMLNIDTLDEIDTDQPFVKVIEQFTKKTGDKYKLGGKGFGYNGATKWNPNEYIKIKKERDNTIITTIKTIITNLEIILNQSKTLGDELVNILHNSILLKYVIQELNQTSLLNMSDNSDLYKVIFDFLEIIALEESIKLFHNNLFTILENLSKKMTSIHQLTQSFSKSNDHNVDFATLLSQIMNMIEIPYKKYTESIHVDTINSKKNILNVSKYVKEMEKFKWMTSNVYNNKYHYNSYINSTTANMRTCFKRLSNEIPSLADSLPISEESSVFMCVDPVKINAITFMIIGPAGTPYSMGVFIFDAYMPPDYPKSGPSFAHVNSHGYKFNPNLYTDGKICLSLLGTYSGSTPDESERWMPDVSTLNQIIISLQSQILTDKPYFNEPGRESVYHTSEGKMYSQEYNEQIQVNTFLGAINKMIINKHLYPNFEEAITTHFRLMKDKIINQGQMWIKNCANEINKKNLIKALDDFELLSVGLK